MATGTVIFMNGNRTRRAGMSDMLLITAAAAAVIVIWSLLAKDTAASVAGLGVALWFPLSILLYRLLLRWLPVIDGVRLRPMDIAPGLRRQVTAACLLTASLSILCLTSQPAPVAIADIVALNFACLAALLDRSEGWMPNYVLVPMLLAGLVAGILHDSSAQAILGATAAWIVVSLALVALSITLRANFLSGTNITMAAACGAWVGLEGLWTFLCATAFVHWASCVLLRHVQDRAAAERLYLDNTPKAWTQPMGPSFALAMALAMLLPGFLPGLPDWILHLASQKDQY